MPAYLGCLSYLSGGLKASTSDHYVSHDISIPLDDSFISFSYVYNIYIYIVDYDDDYDDDE